MELTDAISDYVTERLQALSKFTDLTRDGVFLYAEVGSTSNHHKNSKTHFQAEFTCTIDGKKYFVREQGEDLYAAIDEARDELIRRVRSGKTKDRDLWKRGQTFIKRILRRGGV